MATQTFGATFPGNALKHVAYRADLEGASRGQIVRYLAYLASGLTHNEAANRVMPKRDLSEFASGTQRTQAQIDTEILDAIRARFPGKDIGWVLRYQAAMIRDGADESFAIEVADGIRRGRPRKTAEVA